MLSQVNDNLRNQVQSAQSVCGHVPFSIAPPKSLKYEKMKLATLLLYFVVISNSLSSAYCRNSASIPFFRYPKNSFHWKGNGSVQIPKSPSFSCHPVVKLSSFIPLFQKKTPKIFQYPLLATRTLLNTSDIRWFFPFLKRVRDMDSFPGSSPEQSRTSRFIEPRCCAGASETLPRSGVLMMMMIDLRVCVGLGVLPFLHN